MALYPSDEWFERKYMEPEDWIVEEIMKIHPGEWDAKKLSIDLQSMDNWGPLSRVHDWRNYIPEPIKDNWFRFSTEARMAFFYMAMRQADAENWEKDER